MPLSPLSRQLITAFQNSPTHQKFSRLSYNVSAQVVAVTQLALELERLARELRRQRGHAAAYGLPNPLPDDRALKTYVYERLDHNLRETKRLLLTLDQIRRQFYEVL